MKHHTKEKGDIGVAHTIADLSDKGFKILTPLTEHLPFDLVAYERSTNTFYRIQCKYRAEKNGVLTTSIRSSYSSTKGSSSVRYEQGSFDVLSIFCPDTKQVYYIKEEDLQKLSTSITLRIAEPKPSASKSAPIGCRFATEYLNFPYKQT